MTARSYHPPVAAPTSPGVVYLHGGAFVRGSLDTHDRLCRKLCARGELIVVSVAYRLAPENRFPSAHDDAADATAWVSEHADELGIDAAALAIAGDSSGAHWRQVLRSPRKSKAQRSRPRACCVLHSTPP